MDMLFTSDVLRKLPHITEDILRSAIRRDKLHPHRAPNGLFIWSEDEVKVAKELFKNYKPKRAGRHPLKKK